MQNKNPRINVTFEEETAGIIANLASLENKSISSIVRELALEALDRREDLYLSTLAEKIDKPGAKTYNHSDAWK